MPDAPAHRFTDWFRPDPNGWMIPKERLKPIPAYRAVGMPDPHIRFVSSIAKASRVPEVRVIRDMRLLSAERMAAAQSLIMGQPWLPWTRVPMVRIDAERLAVGLVKGAGREQAVPVFTDGKHIWYAIAEGPNAREARNAVGERARFVVATPKTISTLYYRHFDDPRQHVFDELDRENWRSAMGWLLTECVYCGGGVENIYLEPGPYSGQVFVQVEGVRKHLHSFPLLRSESRLDAEPEGVFGRLINLIGADIVASPDAVSVPGALTALIPAQLDGRFDFRVEIKKTLYGRAVVLRPFDLQADVAEIDLLGIDARTRERLHAAIEAPYGLILVVGPTSSGKNTSAISMLYATDPLARSVQTVEHPVEVRVAAWEQHQIEVKETDAEKIEEAQRVITDSLLRSAPQVIYWGEVRNADAMQRAISAANTGHLTMTTYHSGDASSAILRMRAERTRAGDRIDMVSVGELLIGILAQRLLRRVCPACSRAESRDEVFGLLREFGLATDHARRAGEGCEHCAYTGYSGRILAYEWFEPQSDVDLDTARPAALRATMQEDLYGCGLRRIAEGHTDMAEVIRVLRPRRQDSSREPMQRTTLETSSVTASGEIG